MSAKMRPFASAFGVGLAIAAACSPVLAQEPFSSSQPGYPNWSAFTGIRWEKDRPIVRFRDQWYELVSINGATTEAILEKCKEENWDARKRVAEDLVQIVRLMGHEIHKNADLVLRDKEGNLVTLTDAPMTEENRSQLRGRLPMASRRRNQRERPRRLSREEALDDIKAFKSGLESQFAYLKTNGVDYQSAIREIAERAREGAGRDWLSLELQRVMAKFIDGHARVRGFTNQFADGFLPFLIESSGELYVAVRPDRSGLVDDGFPYLRAIDGVEISDWLESTEKYVAAGSTQYRRRRGLRMLRAIQQFRAELGLEQTETIQARLVDRKGTSTRDLVLKVSDREPDDDIWPPVLEPQILAGNIGYLRLESMDEESVRLLSEWMPRFRETRGMIIDVRGNGGGIRTPILELAGYLLTADDDPRIGNVAKYRLAANFRNDHLSRARFVYREDSPRFSKRDRIAIRLFKPTFKPEWSPPVDEFSEWHYLVLSKDADDPRFDYRRPVAILLDEHCFSATDIFLGVFKGWPRVTLVGQASSGGSAMSWSFQLPRSGITVKCASMASFQPSGQLYDTRGVQPDITVKRPPEYYVRGGGDVILTAALSVLRDRSSAE